MQLEGRTALVTGGARRLGAALCRALSAAGCGVVIHYRRSGREAAALASALRRAGGRAWTVRGDLRAPGAAGRLVRQAAAAAGRLDILVNNAAVFHKRSLRTAAAAAMRAEWETNLLAPLLLMREFARGRRRGRIVNLLDTRIASGRADAVPYSLAKKSLADLTRLAARELAPGITVNGVAPGPVLPADRARAAREPAGPLPLRRRPAAEDVAAAVLYLAQADAVTGQVVFVDGGQHLLG